MSELLRFSSGSQPLRISPNDTFSIRLKLPPIKVYLIGYELINLTKQKWAKRRERLARLRKQKEQT